MADTQSAFAENSAEKGRMAGKKYTPECRILINFNLWKLKPYINRSELLLTVISPERLLCSLAQEQGGIII